MNNKYVRKKIAGFTGIVFFFLLVSHTLPADRTDSQKRISDLTKQGEMLYSNGQFEQALAVFQEAISLDSNSRDIHQLFLNISRTYFRLNNREKSEEYLRKIFERDERTVIEDSEFENEYRMMVQKISAEYWFSVKTANQIDKQEERRIIAQMSKKPEKKKNKLLSWMLVGGVLVGATLAMMLLMKDNSNENIGTLKVTNLSGSNITVIIGTIFRSVESSKSILIYLVAGSYNAEIHYMNAVYFYPVEIQPNKTSILTFSGP